jgi:excinuclease ABC subunit C
LLDLSSRNAKYFRMEKQKQQVLRNPKIGENRILETIQRDLRLAEKPVVIECFDNSNFQGSYPVAACVVFKNSKPHKKEYRHYNIKAVEGPNDFASMEEVVYRRYKRIILEKGQLPQLIVVDGGKGQLSAAVSALEKLNLRGKMAIIGIAKRLEEIYFPGDSVPLYINKNSETLKIIQQLRDEAHRFGISFHRRKRSKNFATSQLMNITGIGQITTKKLLRDFKSVENIKNAEKSAIVQSVGSVRANIVYQYFHPESLQ